MFLNYLYLKFSKRIIIRIVIHLCSTIKKLLMRIFTLFVSLSFIVHFAVAQDCGKFYPFDKGTVMEFTSYDKKDKQEGRMIYKVKAVKDTPEGKKATIDFEMYDKKDEKVDFGESGSTEFAVQCNGEKTMIDIESMMLGNPMLSSYKGMEITMEGNHIMIPNQLSTGEELPDADLKIKVNTGVMNINMSSKIFNRKVVGQEKITTAAGSFDTFIITYETEFKMGVSRQMKGKQWIAQNVGMVKEELYNKNDKLTGYTELTGLQK